MDRRSLNNLWRLAHPRVCACVCVCACVRVCVCVRACVALHSASVGSCQPGMSSFFGIKVGSEQKEPNARENSTAAEEESSSLDSLLSTLPQDSKITEPQTTKMTEPQTMLSKAKSFLAEQRKSLAPWSEFAATPSNPKTVGEATKRVLYNVGARVCVCVCVCARSVCVCDNGCVLWFITKLNLGAFVRPIPFPLVYLHGLDLFSLFLLRSFLLQVDKFKSNYVVVILLLAAYAMYVFFEGVMCLKWMSLHKGTDLIL